MTSALALENVNRGYLASNQLTQVQNRLPTHLEATVVTTMSEQPRPFSWLWDEGKQRALLVNRVTGTLFDPVSGAALNSSPQIADAPIAVPQLTIGARLPVGVFSTSERSSV